MEQNLYLLTTTLYEKVICNATVSQCFSYDNANIEEDTKCFLKTTYQEDAVVKKIGTVQKNVYNNDLT